MHEPPIVGIDALPRSSGITDADGPPMRTGAGHNAARSRRNGRRRISRRDMPGNDTPGERDLDLVEASFVEGFTRCSDPTSFLRLAGIPFVGIAANGRQLHLLRVEIKDITDVGSAVPLLGGEGIRYDPLPEARVAPTAWGFVYHDGAQVVHAGICRGARAGCLVGIERARAFHP